MCLAMCFYMLTIVVSPFVVNSQRSGWTPTFGDLTYNLAVQYGWVYGLSVTEMEIVHGAFRKCNPNGKFYMQLRYLFLAQNSILACINK